MALKKRKPETERRIARSIPGFAGKRGRPELLGRHLLFLEF
jgi:hypothetical protein